MAEQTRSIDGVLVEWGERLFYPGNRRVAAGASGARAAIGTPERAAAIRARIAATVLRRAPQVMVKVTGGGRGMAGIAAPLRYISKGGRLPFEDDRGLARDGKDAVRDVVEQWRLGGSRIPEESTRREAFNIMLSMPAGTRPDIVQAAAREFAKAELANHRYVMVLHTHQANPHVHLSVRAEGRDGRRLNPRKEDLRRWREVFAEKLRARGIEADATSQSLRGVRRQREQVWERNTVAGLLAPKRSKKLRMSPSHRRAGEAWARMAQALVKSPDASDRELGIEILNYVSAMPVVEAEFGKLPRVRREQPEVTPRKQTILAQRELPTMERTRVERTRRGPEMER
jgi:hypothetical protein